MGPPAPAVRSTPWEWYTRVYTVPRRWSVSTLLVATTLYALLCAGLRLVRAPAQILLVVSAFLVFVAIAQLILPQAPRLASAFAGVLFFCIGSWVSAIRHAPAAAMSADAFMVLAFSGAILGYLAGSILAGIFLLADSLQAFWRWYRRPRD